MKKLLVVALLAAAVPGISQTTNKDVLLKHWKTSGELTVAVANAMPAEDYSFRPVPAEMSFGEQMVHIAAADRGACAVASGLTAPALPAKVGEWMKDLEKADVDKATAVEFLENTFAFCQKAITEMPAGNMDKVMGPAKRNLTGSEWLWSYFTHTAHHRGQAEVYLRLKGITPPTYEF